VSRKMINYCENVYESTSLSGVSVWWLKIDFLALVDRKCFSLSRISRKCSEELVVFSPQA
jgi:hypothetical protein